MIETERLTLRGWKDSDIPPFDAMGRDPRVMAYFPTLMLQGEAAAAVALQQAIQATLGYCFWAIERKSDRAFLGFCGVKPGPEETPVQGELEIGWRLARNHWQQGYAREAAEASLAWVWENTVRRRVLAITVPANERSRTLMSRIGMTHVEDGNFDHPGLVAGHPLRRHLLYRIDRPS